MDEILLLVSINGERNCGHILTFNYTMYLFWIADTSPLESNNGVVYILIGIKYPHFVYIGETQYISAQLANHNSGKVSSMANPLRLRSFVEIVNICGFDDNNIFTSFPIVTIEIIYMHRLKRNSITNTKQIACGASDIVEQNNLLPDIILPIQLKIILLFNK